MNKKNKTEVLLQNMKKNVKQRDGRRSSPQKSEVNENCRTRPLTQTVSPIENSLQDPMRTWSQYIVMGPKELIKKKETPDAVNEKITSVA